MRNIDTVISKFSSIIMGLKLVTYAKFHQSNLLLTKVMAKKKRRQGKPWDDYRLDGKKQFGQMIGEKHFGQP